MGRPIEPILHRIAKHCTPAVTAAELENYQSTDHLIWTGAFKPKNPTPGKVITLPPLVKYGSPRRQQVAAKVPKPYFRGPNVNPVRILFDYPNPLDHYVHLRNDCGNDACINPRHYQAQAVYSTRYDRSGVLPRSREPQTEFDEDNVLAILEAFDDPDMKDFSNPLDWAEAVRRRKETAP